LLGSTLFTLTWKLRVTPSGRSIYALRASGRRTSGSDCSSWPTPLVNDELGSTHCYGPKPKDGSERKRFWKLPGAAMLASWPTPNAEHQNDTDSKWQERRAALKAQHKNGNGFGLTLGMAASLAPWPTPMSAPTSEASHNQVSGQWRRQMAMCAPWRAPNQRDWKGASAQSWRNREVGDKTPTLPDQVLLVDSGQEPNGSPASTAKRGQLNPGHSRWLMGLPHAWDLCAPTKVGRASRSSTARRAGSGD